MTAIHGLTRDPKSPVQLYVRNWPVSAAHARTDRPHDLQLSLFRRLQGFVDLAAQVMRRASK